LLFAQAGRQK